MIHSFITVTVFEQVISLPKANKRLNLFRLMWLIKMPMGASGNLGPDNKKAPRTLKRRTPQQKITRLYQ